MKIITLICLLTLLFGVSSYAQSPEPPNIPKVQYKKYEKFDLGELNIKGKILTPGDISVKEKRLDVITEGLYNRDSFSDELENLVRDLN